MKWRTILETAKQLGRRAYLYALSHREELIAAGKAAIEILIELFG